MGRKRSYSGPRRRVSRANSRRELSAAGAVDLVAQLDDAIARNQANRDPARRRTDLTDSERTHLVFLTISPHARHHRRNGIQVDTLVRCTATRREQLGRAEHMGAEGKVIYDSVELAQRAADALIAAGLGQLYAYPCGRSRSGHAHLTSSPPSQWSPRLRGLAAQAQRDWVERQIRREVG
jgi:hypothetical protein